MLTDLRIRQAKPTAKPYRIADGKGLVLEVRPTGAKFWRYRYRLAGAENLYTLGEYPSVSLSAAREERARLRDLVKRGIPPLAERTRALALATLEASNTFEGVAAEWMERKGSGWVEARRVQVERLLKADVLPYIGALPVRSITPAAVLGLLQRIEDRGVATRAGFARQVIGDIMRFAVATLRADADPTAPLKGALKTRRVEHHAPLDANTLSRFCAAVDAYGGDRATVIALRLLTLTFVRCAELCGGRWAEVDWDARVWRIPGERMKGRQDHLVPLSRQALALLQELRGLSPHTLMFPNRNRPQEPMATSTLRTAFKRMGFDEHSPHSLRGTASTRLNELGYRPDLIEKQLGHAEPNAVRRSYNHASYLDERRAMMQAYADWVDAVGKTSA